VEGNNIKSRINEVVESFDSGLYCSQAILSTYCEEFGLDKEIALKLSCGMAAGMARLSSTCGAVTGAYMVISLKHGNCVPEDKDSTEKTFALIQEFDKCFIEKHGSTNCRELLGVDLRYGDKELAGQQVRSLCSGFVKDAAEILETILCQDERN
jgi:C_GCAxxG_C_C family probable redox protein